MHEQQILYETSTYLGKAYVYFTHNYNEVSTHHFETQGMHVRCRFSENLTDFFCALTGVFIPKISSKSSDKQVYDSILNQTKRRKTENMFCISSQTRKLI